MVFKGWLRETWRQIRGSYWFIPSFMAVAALLLSQLTLYMDRSVGSDWIDYWEFLYATRPDGARAILSTIAGSMIGVAGVTFSITIAAVAYASGQFGPRIIDNFMEDQGNQITLGTFISTFLYCLLVLRTVRGSDEGVGFVPYGSMALAVGLALASLGVLIYFIHHIPESIHVYHVVADIGNQLEQQADRLFSEEPPEEGTVIDLPSLDKPTYILRAPTSGYIQSIEYDTLVSRASQDNALVKLDVEPGAFVAKSMILGRVYGGEDSQDRNFEATFLIGRERSPTQDIRFLINKLIDIAARALSPGVNDPFTAMSCIDWLSAVFLRIGKRSAPSIYRSDQDGKIVLMAPRSDFETLLFDCWDKLRPYVSKDRNVTFHMLESALSMMDALPPKRALSVYYATQRLIESSLEILTHPRDREKLTELREALREAGGTEAWQRKAHQERLGEA